MLRYKSIGAAKCSAIAARAIRARAPAASTRPPAEQKIHTGKKEPKMLYSGAWEQPTNTSGAARDKPARRQSGVIRRRSRSVDSVFMSGRPHMCRTLVLNRAYHLADTTGEDQLSHRQSPPHDHFALDMEGQQSRFLPCLSGALGDQWTASVLRFDLATELRTESIGRKYRSIPSHQMNTLGPTHFDRGHMGLKFAIAVGEKTPSPVNLLKRNLACAAREDTVHRCFGIDRYVRPIDSAPHFCLNSY